MSNRPLSASKRLILKLLAARDGMSTADLATALRHENHSPTQLHCRELEALGLITRDRAATRPSTQRNGPPPTVWRLATQPADSSTDSRAAAA